MNPELGARFIEAGPEDPRNAASVRSLAKAFRMAKRTTTWLRDRMPWLYAAAYRLLRSVSYTHLDVYKRQHEARTLRISSESVPALRITYSCSTTL